MPLFWSDLLVSVHPSAFAPVHTLVARHLLLLLFTLLFTLLLLFTFLFKLHIRLQLMLGLLLALPSQGVSIAKSSVSIVKSREKNMRVQTTSQCCDRHWLLIYFDETRWLPRVSWYGCGGCGEWFGGGVLLWDLVDTRLRSLGLTPSLGRPARLVWLRSLGWVPSWTIPWLDLLPSLAPSSWFLSPCASRRSSRDP